MSKPGKESYWCAGEVHCKCDYDECICYCHGDGQTTNINNNDQ